MTGRLQRRKPSNVIADLHCRFDKICYRCEVTIWVSNGYNGAGLQCVNMKDYFLNTTDEIFKLGNLIHSKKPHHFRT